MQMPQLDGLQSTRLIRKLGYSGPIVALTAFAVEDIVKEGLDSGIDQFMRCVPFFDMMDDRDSLLTCHPAANRSEDKP